MRPFVRAHIMRKLVLLIVLLMFALSACRVGHVLRHESHTHGGRIHGSAYFLERMLLPPDAVLDVQLIDDRVADTANAVIAQQTFAHLQGPPYDFVLNYDPGSVQKGMSYSLHAALRSGDGHLEFVTDSRVPVTIGSKDVVSFRMVRAPASP